jgi:Bacterial dnaA protein helix-turn-helix
MNIAIASAESAPANDATDTPPGRYDRYATVFSRIYKETASIAVALEVVDAYRAREMLTQPRVPDFGTLVVAIVARRFSLRPKLLFDRNRHRDVTSARYVAAWILFRHRWAKAKIATYFHLDHSTVIHGLKRVASDNALLVAAHLAEQLLDDAQRSNAVPREG